MQSNLLLSTQLIPYLPPDFIPNTHDGCWANKGHCSYQNYLTELEATTKHPLLYAQKKGKMMIA